MTPEKFVNWISQASPGESVVYAKTSLFAQQCEKDKGLAVLRDMAWQSPCCLTQRRVGWTDALHPIGIFEYIATKSDRPARKNRPKPSFYMTVAEKVVKKLVDA